MAGGVGMNPRGSTRTLFVGPSRSMDCHNQLNVRLCHHVTGTNRSCCSLVFLSPAQEVLPVAATGTTLPGTLSLARATASHITFPSILILSAFPNI